MLSISRSLRLLILLLLPTLLLGCKTASPSTVLASKTSAYSLAQPAELPDRYTIPLESRHGFLFARGQLNQKHPGLFLFDTGSNLNIVDQGLANRLGMETIDQRTTLGVAGTADFTVRLVDELSLGGLDLGLDRVGVLSMYPLTRGLGMNPAGLIGFTAFANHPFTLDYQNHTLTVYRRDTFVPPPDATRVPLVNYRGLPAVRAKLGGGQDVLLILDSGADNAVSLPESCAPWPGLLASGVTSPSQARGVGGDIHTRRGWLRKLDIFGLQLYDVPVTFEPPPPGLTDPRITLGRVGNQLLSSFRLTFDARRHFLWVEFLPESP